MEIIQCLYILPDKDNVSFYFLMKMKEGCFLIFITLLFKNI